MVVHHNDITSVSVPPPSGCWGANAASFRSCDSLIRRIENNDPTLKDLVILPGKDFGAMEIERLAAVLLLEPSNNHHNSNWRSLSASSHVLPPASLKRFGHAIARNRSRQLRVLAIGDKTMGDQGVDALCQGLRDDDGEEEDCHSENNQSGEGKNSRMMKCSCSLERVDLSFKGMSSRGFYSIVSCFGRSENLKELNLSRNDLSGSTFSLDLNLLDQNDGCVEGNDMLFPRLVDIDLSSCNLNEEFVRTFFPRLQSRMLKKLRLTNNPLLGDASFQALAAMQLWEWIEELYVSECGIGDDSMQFLASSSSKDGKSMLLLDFSGNSITSRGASSLSSCLGGGSGGGSGGGHDDDHVQSSPPFLLARLSELNLAQNPLGGDGVKSIVAGLVARRRQRWESNNDEQEGAEEIFAPRLNLLDLSESNCDPSGAVAAVRDASVQKLRLFHNNLGSIGFRALAQADVLSGGHPVLEFLDLAGNGADQASVVELLESLLVAPTCFEKSALRTLVIGGNETGSAVEETIARVKQVHRELDIARDRLKTTAVIGNSNSIRN